MFVYLFHSQEWNLVGELQSNVLMNKEPRLNSTTHNLDANSDLHFSYTLQYAKEYVNSENYFALSSLLPIRIMEVFKNPVTTKWLAQFYPVELSKIDPSNTIGNVIVSNQCSIAYDPINAASVLVTELLDKTRNTPTNLHNAFDIGYCGGLPYWLVATDGKNIFPTRAIEIAPELVPVMLPISGNNRFGQSLHLDFDQDTIKTYLNIINALNHRIAEEIDYESMPVTLTNLGFVRYDIIKTEFGYEYIGVEKLNVLFNKACSYSDDLLQVMFKIVSTYQQVGNSKGCLRSFITELLKRDLLLRLFDSSFSITEIDVIKFKKGYKIAPLLMQVFNGIKSHNRNINHQVDWRYPVCENHQMDYPILCEALSEIIEPHELLLALSGYAEQLLKIPLPVDKYESGSNFYNLLDTMASFDQKLARWGLVI